MENKDVNFYESMGRTIMDNFLNVKYANEGFICRKTPTNEKIDMQLTANTTSDIEIKIRSGCKGVPKDLALEVIKYKALLSYENQKKIYVNIFPWTDKIVIFDLTNLSREYLNSISDNKEMKKSTVISNETKNKAIYKLPTKASWCNICDFDLTPYAPKIANHIKCAEVKSESQLKCATAYLENPNVFKENRY